METKVSDASDTIRDRNARQVGVKKGVRTYTCDWFVFYGRRNG